MSRMEMSILAMNKVLRELGWIQIGSNSSGVFQKNHCYFVMYRKELPSPIGVSSERLGVGAELMTHFSGRSWYVEKHGFYIDSGSIAKYVSYAYEAGFVGEDAIKLEKFAKQINSYAELSDIEALSAMKRENVIRYNNGMENHVALSEKGISDTGMFVINAKIEPRLLKYFKDAMLYQIASLSEEKILEIQSYDGSDSIEVSLQTLLQLEHKGALVAVEIHSKQKENISYSYESIISGKKAEVGPEFDKFGLNTVQKAILATAMTAGANFSCLLNNRLTPEAMKKLLVCLTKGIDCDCIIGKQVSVEHANFLARLAENGYAINRFSEGESEEVMQQKYSELLEGIQYSLSAAGCRGEQADVMRRLAFRWTNYHEVIKSTESYTKISLRLLKGDIRFYQVAGFLYENGVEHNNSMSVSWITVPQNVKNLVKQLFFADGLQIGDLMWNEFFEDRSTRIVSLLYDSKWGFMLQLPDCYYGTDMNSIFIMDSAKFVIWRAVYVNEEFYFYHSSLIDAYLQPGSL